jgi:hypothetical protein
MLLSREFDLTNFLHLVKWSAPQQMVAQNMGGSMINETISNIVIEWDLTGYNGR